MDNNELDKLEALAKAATPGPWNVTKYCSVMDEGMDTLVVSSDSSHEDRAFIAAANPAVILELVALARRAAQPAIELDKSRAAFEADARKRWGGIDFARKGEGYEHPYIDSEWDGWCAALAANAGQQAEPVAKAARELLNCLDGLPIDTDEASADQLTAFDRTRSRLQKALAASTGQQAVTEPIMADGKTKLSDYLEAGAPTSDMDEWTQGYEECRNRLFSIVGKQLRALAAPAAPSTDLLSADELAAFHRFCECCEDFDSGGYDVDKGMMARLARIGVVRSIGFGRYETTAFGDAIRSGLAAPAAAVGPSPLEYRAQGREEVLQIILAQSSEDPFADCIGWSRSGAPEDEGGTYWDEDKLRALLHIGDRKHDAYDRAEATYWDALGTKEEAERMMRMVERAPHWKPLHDFLAKQESHEAWDLMRELQVAAPLPQKEGASELDAALMHEARELLAGAAEPDATQDKADIGMCAQWDVDALALVSRIDAAMSAAPAQPATTKEKA